MDRNEHLYRMTGRSLIVLLGVWLAAMLLALVLPTKFWTSGVGIFIFFCGIFPLLFVAALVLGVIRIVSYMRWTGKYPYYFLFDKSRSHGPMAGRPKEESSGTKTSP